MASNPNSHKLPLVLLHGLLGDGRDWQPVIEALPGIACHALDLPGHGSNQGVSVTGFEQANQWLCDALEALGIEQYRLAGYSLGGRLALYHASQSPAGLQALLLENCHPGLPLAERAARIEHDEGWARRFEREPLTAVLADWYQQGVFADLDEAARARQAARRLGNQGTAIATMLRATSLGQQPDLAAWLRAEPLVGTRLPVTWLSGSRDHKFHQLACQLVNQGCNINHLTLDGGHNLHASQPETFAQLLREWVASTP
ncbi:2-succinyl-6-hydroxy-2,4-cyclohexadiene-1-carboxylate synthase [Aeromonas sp.]|uniref:2-succinyl-6-hydroxy-2, 4-cyclohexadiene-1-carboxylate synthase n=1 Tax=Aeromonas sp. TaxID=647 RepID=UPI0025825AF1|nr:2-succinyl-6-hydroxy-2,4-cyclohexadiene-1-carboxylate synthase [Aeromonas sp.]MCX7134041.1 2-succinyl-6-hydroxy-2,4-cyclohexadiene-1-carboxylate synthase [Aeromonas sp.]